MFRTRNDESLLAKPELDADKPLTSKALTAAIANLVAQDLPGLIGAQINPLKATMDAINTRLTETMDKGEKKPGKDDKLEGKNLPPEISGLVHELRTSLLATQTELKGMKDKTAIAEQKAQESARKTAILEALAPFKFENETAANAAFRLIDMETSEKDGVYVAGDNLPLATFAKELIPTKLAGLLKADESVGGAGANRGSYRPNTQINMESIKKGMTADERASVVNEITKVIASAQQFAQ